jgi:hypothetical protein
MRFALTAHRTPNLTSRNDTPWINMGILSSDRSRIHLEETNFRRQTFSIVHRVTLPAHKIQPCLRTCVVQFVTHSPLTTVKAYAAV